jgi:hypothetical protein
LKVLSPRLATKALSVLDQSTAVVVSLAWLAALITLIMAMFAVHGAVSAKKEAAAAIVAEPVLPVASTTGLSLQEGQAILDRLQHQFPDLKIEMDSSRAFNIKTEDGSKFHQFTTALSYIDTMAPQYRWTLRDFCVGHCGQDLMRAAVTGQKVTFQLPPRE